MKKLLICALLSYTFGANAHNLFPAHTDKGYTVKFWADDHWEEPKPEKMIGLTAYENGKRTKVGYNFKTGEVVVPAGEQPDLMTAEYHFGYFTFTADKHFHKPRKDVDGAVFDARNIFKLGKGIFKWKEQYSKPIGLKMEVTPISNPLVLKEGDKLKVLVTLDGKPYANASFEDQVSDLDDVHTDTNGIAEIPIRKPQEGFEIIGASAKLPYALQDPKAQTLQLTGTLAFKVAQ